MEYLFYLPSELYLILRDLPDEFLQHIELHPYELENITFLPLVENLVNQFEAIIEMHEFQDDMAQHIRDTYLLLATLARQFEKVDQSITQISTFTELVCKVRSFHNLNRGTYDIDLSNLQDIEEPLMILARLTKGYSEVNQSFIEMIHHLGMIFTQYGKIIHKNLLPINLLIRQISPVLSGFPEMAEPIFTPLLKLAQTLNAQYLQAIGHHSMGMVYTNQSQLNKALEAYETSLQFSTKHGFPLQFASMNNLGIVHIDLGELERAEQIYEELYHGENPVLDITKGGNLANVYNLLGKHELAIPILEKFERSNFPILYVHENLHKSYLGVGRVEAAKKIEEEAQVIYENNPINYNLVTLKEMRGRREYQQGNLYAAKQAFEDKLEHFKKIKQLKGIFQSYSELIRIQIDFYRLQPDNLVIKNQLYSLVETLQQLVDEQGMAMAAIENMLIRADLLMMDDLIDEAKMDAYNALKLANEYEYQALISKAQEKYDEITALSQDDAELQEEEKEGIFSRIRQAAGQLLRLSTSGNLEEKENAEVHGLIIIGQGGISIFDYYIGDKLTSEPALISGLISAVSSFMTEIAKGKGYLKSIGHDDLSLLLEPVDEYLLVCISSEESFDLRDKTRVFAEKSTNLIRQHHNEITRGSIGQNLITTLEKYGKQIFQV